MTPADRRTLSIVAIVAVVLWCVWAMLVRPASREANARQAELVAIQSELALAAEAGATREDIDRASADADRLSARLIDLWTEIESPSAIYDTLDRDAAAAGLVLDGIHPGRADQPMVLTAGVGPDGNPREVHVVETAYRLEVHGSFDQVLALVDRLERECGATRVRSLLIEPVRDGGADGAQVTADIRTQHFTLTVPDGSGFGAFAEDLP